MKGIVDILRREKTQLAAEVNRLERELLVRSISGGPRSVSADGGVHLPSGIEVTLNATATIGQSNDARQELVAKTQMLELEKAQFVTDLATAKSDLDEERGRSAKLVSDKQEMQNIVKELKQELAENQLKIAALENKMNEQKSEFARVMKDAENHHQEAEQYEARLAEKTEQLRHLRTMLDKQKATIVQTKAKADEAAAQAREAQRQLQERDAQHQAVLQEREEVFQRAANKKFELLAEEHRKDLAAKDEEIQKARKKIRKMEAQVQKAKEKYDEKVCEYEDLFKLMEEQKVEAMKLIMRQGQTVEQVQVFDQQDQIKSTLERAKEEQRRKRDKFANGESTSALAQVRAAGGAVHLLKGKYEQQDDNGTAGGGSRRQSQLRPPTRNEEEAYDF